VAGRLNGTRRRRKGVLEHFKAGSGALAEGGGLLGAAHGIEASPEGAIVQLNKKRGHRTAGASVCIGRASGARSEGHSAAADSGAIEKRVSDGGGYRHDGSFAGAGGGDIFAIEQDGFD
jgi:hypothetical protein